MPPLFPSWALFAAAALAAEAASGGSVVLAEETSPGAPSCEEFFDTWEMPGVPANMLAMGGIGREMMAAEDCVRKNDLTRACAHWGKVLEVTDRLGPPFNKDRVGLEQRMREHGCAAPRPATGPTPPPEDAAEDGTL